MNPAALPSVRLGRSGVELTRLVLGCASIGGLYAAMDEEQAHAVLESAWAGGVRAFDTAPHYGVGLSEERLGRFLASLRGPAPVISTKVGRLLVDTDEDVEGVDGFYGTPRRRRVRDFSRDGVRRSLAASCGRLGRDVIDVVFIHDPEGDERQALDEAYPALVELRDAGVVRAIGVGTKDRDAAMFLVERAELDCVMIAGEYSLLGTAAADTLFPACAARGVAVLVAGVYKSGVLADPRPGAHVDYVPADEALLAQVQHMRAVSETRGVPLPAAALQFVLAHPAVRAAVVGAASPAEVRDNIAHLSRPIPDGLFDELGAIAPAAGDPRR